jgi:uncharacterized membrane protein
VTATVTGLAALRSAIYLIGHVVCHQNPERSLWIGGAPLPVCARCTGIYGGVFLALLLRGKWRRSWLVAAIVLLALDWSSEALGLRPAWAPLRVLTGAFLGWSAAPAVEDGIREMMMA